MVVEIQISLAHLSAFTKARVISFGVVYFSFHESHLVFLVQTMYRVLDLRKKNKKNKKVSARERRSGLMGFGLDRRSGEERRGLTS